MTKENVYERDDRTEEGMKESQEGREASTVPSKFKDVDALARAYESLQAEFTRRSQRLRELEKRVENFPLAEGESGAEKLRKVAKARRKESKEFDDFVAEIDRSARETAEEARSACETACETALPPSAPPSKGVGASATGETPDSVEIATQGEEISSDELLERARADEWVRLRIVGEYLSSLGKAVPPVTGGGAGVLATPKSRAKTVGEAGNMALAYFRKPLVD